VPPALLFHVAPTCPGQPLLRSPHPPPPFRVLSLRLFFLCPREGGRFSTNEFFLPCDAAPPWRPPRLHRGHYLSSRIFCFCAFTGPLWSGPFQRNGRSYPLVVPLLSSRPAWPFVHAVGFCDNARVLARRCAQPLPWAPISVRRRIGYFVFFFFFSWIFPPPPP